MATLIQDSGAIVDYTPGSAVGVGDIVVVGTLVGYAMRPIAANELGALLVRGVVRGPKTSGQAIAGGAAVYWDSDPGEFTTTSAGNTLAGKAVPAGALAADGEVDVILGA